MEEKYIKLCEDFVHKTDGINKRLVIALVAVVAVLSVLIGAMVITYFTADYGYGYSIDNTNSDNNKNFIGADADEEAEQTEQAG